MKTLRTQAQIAVEGIICELITREEPWSSRVQADRIVDLVIRIMRGDKVDVAKPWESFALGKANVE